MLLKSRSPAMTEPRIGSGPMLLTGICFCAVYGGAMTLRTGKSGRYRYLSDFCHIYSTAAPGTPNDESRTSPNCASGRPRQTPNSSGSTTRLRTVSPIYPTPC